MSLFSANFRIVYVHVNTHIWHIFYKLLKVKHMKLTASTGWSSGRSSLTADSAHGFPWGSPSVSYILRRPCNFLHPLLPWGYVPASGEGDRR